MPCCAAALQSNESDLSCVVLPSRFLTGPSVRTNRQNIPLVPLFMLTCFALIAMADAARLDGETRMSPQLKAAGHSGAVLPSMNDAAWGRYQWCPAACLACMRQLHTPHALSRLGHINYVMLQAAKGRRLALGSPATTSHSRTSEQQIRSMMLSRRGNGSARAIELS